MKVGLLYSGKDWSHTVSYFDWNNIVKDLGLGALFTAAAGERKDTYLSDALRQVMRVPLLSREEILYRQEILNDCFNKEGFAKDLYDISVDVLAKWDKLGRKIGDKVGNTNSVGNLITQIHVLRLLVEGLSEVKELLESNMFALESAGFGQLYDRVCKEYSDELEEHLQKILEDFSFYTDVSVKEYGKNVFMSNFPRIVIDCGLQDGLKFSDIRLEEFTTVVKKYRSHNGVMSVLQGYVNKIAPDCVALQNDVELTDQADRIVQQVVSYVISCCQPFMNSFGRFFDQLHFQMGFYLAAINLRHRMGRCNVEWCIPEVGEQDSLEYQELKELVMSFGQSGKVVGNTANVDGKRLIVITGANQGGKSTFLRSVGIAQIMMQCGLQVAATSYRSGIYPEFFTHFTRREDSAMNSGRLDEELRRMDQILEHLGENSMILLNESFASTTEKEGSEIAYDIIKALHEEGIRILTVTHLLSFARQVYAENEDLKNTDVEFLSAERLEDGTRTFRMVNHEPELTSFGLDLYREMIEEKLGKGADGV